MARGLLIGRIAHRLSRRQPAVRRALLAQALSEGLVVHHGKAPAPARQLARDGHRHDRRAQAPARFEVHPAPVKAHPGRLGAGAHLGPAARAPALEATLRARRAPVVPGGLHQQAPGMAVAGLGDRAACVAGARLGLARGEAQVGADRGAPRSDASRRSRPPGRPR